MALCECLPLGSSEVPPAHHAFFSGRLGLAAGGDARDDLEAGSYTCVKGRSAVSPCLVKRGSSSDSRESYGSAAYGPPTKNQILILIPALSLRQECVLRVLCTPDSTSMYILVYY